MAKITIELEQLIEALNASLVTRCKDECGDWRIAGRCGHIYAQPEGFYIYCEAGSPKAWTWMKRALSFCKVTQDGDDEGFLLLDRFPTPEEAEIIRDKLGIRRRREMTEASLEVLKKMRAKSPLSAARQAKRGEG